jgi:hypothetical protein
VENKIETALKLMEISLLHKYYIKEMGRGIAMFLSGI